MLFKSNLIAAASGSVGGTTFSHNRSGMYMRSRAIPVNPNSTRQQAIRGAMSSLVTYWLATLTAAQRAAWKNYADNTPFTNPLGDSFNLTGQQAFLRANIQRVRGSAAIVASGPTVYDTGQPVTNLASVVVSGGNITFNYTVGGAGTDDTGYKLIQIGSALNASRNFFKGPWQQGAFVSFVAGVTAFAPSFALASAWDAAYQPAVGDNLPVQITNYYDDGRVSTKYSQLITVT